MPDKPLIRLTYKGKAIQKIKAKNAGKNRGEYDGFYQSLDGKTEYFIKKPALKAELFAELFAGLLLEELIQRGLIDPVYQASLIRASCIRLPNGAYALIQPKVAFTELCRIIGTTNYSQSDRSVWQELFTDYGKLREEGSWFGLPTSLMLSILLGDNSVHSANVVRLNQTTATSPRQFARIDLGAAFRYYGHEENNKDVLKTKEIQDSIFGGYSKNYYAKYRSIPGLFYAIAASAKHLQALMAKTSDVSSAVLMVDIVSAALEKVPADMLDKAAQEEVANYLCMPSFAQVQLGKVESYKPFAEYFSEIFIDRMQKTSQLQEGESVKKAAAPRVAELITRADCSFVDIVLTLQNMALELTAKDCHQVDLSRLIEKYNAFVDALAARTEAVNLWRDNPARQNILAPHFKGAKDRFYHGKAFVPQAREAGMIRHWFSLPLDMDSKKKASWLEFDEVSLFAEIEDKNWQDIEALLSSARDIIISIHALCHGEALRDASISRSLLQQINCFAKGFMEQYLAMENVFLSLPEAKNKEKLAFYPIEDKELDKMTGEQLATLCLQELSDRGSGMLVARILANNRRWRTMNEVFKIKFAELLFAADNTAQQVNALKLWRGDFESFWDGAKTLAAQLDSGASAEEVKNSLKELRHSYAQLPEALQSFCYPFAAVCQEGLSLKESEQVMKTIISCSELRQWKNSALAGTGSGADKENLGKRRAWRRKSEDFLPCVQVPATLFFSKNNNDTKKYNHSLQAYLLEPDPLASFA